jgi:hypothetical protein
MLRRHVEDVTGHLRVWVSEVQRLDRQPQGKRQEQDAE